MSIKCASLYDRQQRRGAAGGGDPVLSTNDAYVDQGLCIVSQMLRLLPQPA